MAILSNQRKNAGTSRYNFKNDVQMLLGWIEDLRTIETAPTEGFIYIAGNVDLDQVNRIRRMAGMEDSVPATAEEAKPWGRIEAENEVTPIWMGRDGQWVAAEIHEGPYIGTDGKERFDNGSVYNLKSDECFRTFGECYPFGSASGAEVSYYLKNGATIRLRKEG